MEEVYGEHAQMRVGVVIATVLLLLPSAAFAQMEKRIALLIGNRADDTSVGALKNPHNDIAIVGEALSKQAYDIDLGRRVSIRTKMARKE